MRRAVLAQTRPLREGAGVARIGPGDVALTMADLRVVTRFAAECAAEVLRRYPRAAPGRSRVAALTTALDDALRDR